MSRAGPTTFVSILLLTLPGVPSCSDSSHDEPCDAPVKPACTPSYEPTFDNLFTNTFKSSCALAGGSCHASAGHQAGLVLEDADTAYRLLLDGRVVAGKPECSLIARRVLSTDTSFMMPPGLALPPGEQCAITQWIARGAAR